MLIRSLSSLFAVSLAGCAAVAVATATRPEPAPDRSPEAAAAVAYFWDALHAGRYEDVGEAAERLERAWLAHPRDPQIAGKIGLAHLWRASERARAAPRASVTDDITVARRYFELTRALAPADGRFTGFLASALMSEGTIHKDEREVRGGYFLMKDAVSEFPEFNLFTSGYVMSGQPWDGDNFRTALAQQWEVLDVCVDAKVDRATADMRPFLSRETTVGPKRVCWNGVIAPHNFEGFFLNMGDMLVKAGDTTRAAAVYAQAKLSRTYDTWPYRAVLDARLARMTENVTKFRGSQDALPGEERMMAVSSFSCTGCHQER